MHKAVAFCSTIGRTQEVNKGGFLGIRTMKEELTYCSSD